MQERLANMLNGKLILIHCQQSKLHVASQLLGGKLKGSRVLNYGCPDYCSGALGVSRGVLKKATFFGDCQCHQGRV
eukprot:CAMPEP_0178395238 /NCGR_PEP_ID=MMETSP0689_2-20121128/13116_1 /TAXON_ID=160604 /ORGANISM="Amphidinium massartii, Strain CS-259" /LENGTH=75 /DNA_ID=CAMNT_0020015887 /DNA_START=211 /DNA_END=438 /DNA_ORIENTATION=+